MRTKHRLLEPKVKVCPCGKLFEVGKRYKYCSEKCLKKALREKAKRREESDKEFFKQNKDVCSSCGRRGKNNKFRFCLKCRIRGRLFAKKYRLEQKGGKK